jgi:N-acetylmuramoyl-L-alanine amidase
MAKLTHIIIHCSDSDFGTADMIRGWHKRRGWRDIGYHFVIRNGADKISFSNPDNDGLVETGRMLDGDDFLTDNEKGAHALGYNENSIGICLIGIKNFTSNQIRSLLSLIEELTSKHNIPHTNILGHCETASGKRQGKTCPNFPVSDIRERLRLINQKEEN